MSTQLPNDLMNFHEFVAAQIDLGNESLSPEEVVALWRERLATVDAINQGMTDIEAGRTKPLDTFVSEFRNKFGLSQGQ